MSLQIEKIAYAIVGLGKSGMAAARYLQSQGLPFIAVDSNPQHEQAENLHRMSYCQGVYLGELHNAPMTNAERIVLSPGIDPRQEVFAEARQAGAEITNDIALFMQQLKVRAPESKVIAITGSNGKSTVTDWLYYGLKEAGLSVAMGGNIGIPVLDLLQQAIADYYVIELSSFQLDTCQYLPVDVALLLNVSADHMDRYETFADYVASKQQIFSTCKYAIYNLDDANTHPQHEVSHASCFSLVSAEADAYLLDNEQELSLYVEDEKILQASELTLKGLHNYSNLLAILLALKHLNISLDSALKEALCRYAGLPHRFATVHSDNRADWVDDSKATNPGATLAALDSIPKQLYQKVILIAGGDAKGADLTMLTPALQSKVSLMVVFGKDAARFTQMPLDIPVILVGHMREAVQVAAQHIVARSLVLLSPACASLDMYRNFSERGEHFVNCIREVA